jgi:error-prone DNA polymerase
MSFTHLHVHSNFSFLDSGSSVESLLDRAKSVGCDSLALTDHNGLYGAIRFYSYAKKIGVKPIIGVEIDIESGHHIVLLAKNLDGYSNLCKIITRAHLSHEKGAAAASLDIIERYKDDLFCLSGCLKGKIASLVAGGDLESAKVAAERYAAIFGRESFFIELQNHMLPGTAVLNSQLHALASDLGLRCVATNNVHYATKQDFKIQDLMVCVQTITTLDRDHPLRKRNAEYYLKSPNAMADLFRRYPDAIVAAEWIADQCSLDLGLGAYRFPDFPIPDGETAYSYLCRLCFESLEKLYKPINPEIIGRLQHELQVIHDLEFEEYFLVVWDIVREAKSRGIRCSGRGSAADSLVSYCLGITIADPIAHGLLFERFLNPERKGMPDVDIDFDAARRDEIIDYIYKRYGEDKVAMVCTVSTLKARSSIRELGKAMSFSPDDISQFASKLPHMKANGIRAAIEKYPEFRSLRLPIHRLENLIDLCEKVSDFPRHLSVHLAGVVVSRELLTNLVPLEWATKGVIVTQFDKDDIETLGLVKMDILGLRNLSAIEDSLPLIREHHGFDLDIDNIPLDDEPTYEMLRTTDTVGCFQIESPGMRGLLGRLQPREFEDIIAQISLFRPGPMQADMIHPFIARRHGDEEITYLHPRLEPVLRDTHGVILYQEQVLSIAHAFGFTYGQADSLRRAMTHDRSQDEMEKIRDGFVRCACENGIDADIAEEVFSRLRAFAAYGFCKAHAASFAKIAYQTAYLKTHYPAEFFTGILNNEPMGFYPANVIFEEARRIGIRLLGIDINTSQAEFSVEYDDDRVPGIRIGLHRVKGITGTEVDSIISNRPFSSFADYCLRTRCSRKVSENLISCGAFDAFGISRSKHLWLLGELGAKKRKTIGRNDTKKEQAGLLVNAQGMDYDALIRQLPEASEPSLHEKVRTDYEILGLSARCHPLVFYREKLSKAKVHSACEIRGLQDNKIARGAGVVIVCMRPPTKSGAVVVFITLEDESGVVDCVIFKKVYDKYSRIIYGNPALIIEGRVQRQGKAISLIASKVMPLAQSYRTDDGGQMQPFTERIRSAGARSFVRSSGI